jgi:hypothetical protein
MISNQILQDNSLSLTARGLLSHLLSMPPNWQINVNHLLTMFPEGKSRVSNAWKELQEAGYVRKRMLRADGRIAGWDYEVSQDSGNQESSISTTLKNNILESENLENKNLEIRPYKKKQTEKQTVEKEKEDPLPPVGGSEPPSAFASVDADAGEADEQPEDEDAAFRVFLQAAMEHKRPEPAPAPTHAPEPTLEPSPFDDPKPKPKRKRRDQKLDTFDQLERPDWLTDEIWRSYVEHRQALKKPLTEQAAKLAITKLTLMAASKSPATAVSAIENSILNGWSGLFEPRGGHYGERPLTQAERNQQFWAERDAQQNETKIINPQHEEACQPNELVEQLLERCQSSSRGASPRS